MIAPSLLAQIPPPPPGWVCPSQLKILSPELEALLADSSHEEAALQPDYDMKSTQELASAFDEDPLLSELDSDLLQASQQYEEVATE